MHEQKDAAVDSSERRKPTFDFTTARAEYLRGADSIDMDQDGMPEWYLVYDHLSNVVEERIDRDHDGSPEIRITRTDGTLAIALDHGSKGRVDEVRMVHREGTQLKEIVTARDTNADGELDARTVSTYLGGSRFEIAVYEDTVDGTRLVSSVTSLLSFEQPNEGEPTGKSVGCSDPERVEAARGEAASVGWNCLYRMNQSEEADLLAVFLTGATIRCLGPNDEGYNEDYCGWVSLADWGNIYLSNTEGCNPGGYDIEATLFHEALHHSLVLGHQPGQDVTDRVYACDRSCFEDGEDMCLQNACIGAPCEGGQCWAQACNPETGKCGATHDHFNGLECDDGDDCTYGDRCSEDECGGQVIECDDEDRCTEDQCADGSCKYVDNGACIDDCDDCDDGDSCTDDWCLDGACQHTDNGSCSGECESCDDGDACTGDLCLGGKCEHIAMVCDDSDGCTDDRCFDGACQYTDNGSCGGECANCDDNDPCTDDMCVAGECINIPGACKPGDGCTDDCSCSDDALCDQVKSSVVGEYKYACVRRCSGGLTACRALPGAASLIWTCEEDPDRAECEVYCGNPRVRVPRR